MSVVRFRYRMRSFGRWARFLSALALGAAALAFGLVQPAHAASIMVTTTADTLDAAADCASVTIATLPGPDTYTSLREAICAANANAGADTITFDIDNATFGAAPHVISVGTVLPSITTPVTIDGLSEPDVSGGICPLPTAGSLAIQIDGTSAGSSADGLRLYTGSAGTIVRGLSITNFSDAGVQIGDSAQPTSVNTMTCSLLGVEADGSDGGSNGNNYGVSVINATSNTIGGTTVNDANVMAHNSREGIFVTFNSSTNTVRSNIVRGNGIVTDGSGVSVANNSNDNTIQANSIVGNDRDGVRVDSATGNRITRNAISSNGNLGIELLLPPGEGVTPNDVGDGDGGSNHGQNFPVIDTVTSNVSSTTVQFTLDSNPGSYTVEFYSNANCDGSGHGEGSVLLGATAITLPGAQPFTTLLASPTSAAGLVTAIAISESDTAGADIGDTSEFAACAAVDPEQAGGTLVVNTTNDNNGVCSAADCSLREAILQANGDGMATTINFDIAGAGPHVIGPASPLPMLTAPVAINGLSEPDVPGGACPLPSGSLSVQIDGTSAGAGVDGLFVAPGAVGSSIRGLSITRFTDDGIEINASDTAITCNYLGVAANGSTAAGNRFGMTLSNVNNGTNNTVGGATTSDMNVIAHNSPGDGIFLNGTGNIVRGNIIRNNGDAGLDVNIGRRNRLTQNSVYGNTNLGIDIGLDGVTGNDAGDVDTGNGNNLQNSPVISDATSDAVNTDIEFILDSNAGSYTIEFYSTPDCDGNGHGEGQTYLGSASVTLPGAPPFTATLNTSTSGDDVVTAIAISESDTAGGDIADTSEFSACHSVQYINTPPVADDDSYITDEDTELTGNVLGDDTDVDGDALSATLGTGPSNAAAFTLNSDGSFTYTPSADYNGPDSFTYMANDGSADSNLATVTITVNAVSDAPDATGDSYSVDEDTPLTVNAPGVLGNDGDVDGSALTADKVSDPAHGSVALASDGSFTYTPAADYNGPDSFTYMANDGSADSNLATVTITVNAVNDAPDATGEFYSTDEDTPLTVNAPGVLGNDTDVDLQALTVAPGSVTAPGHGTVIVNADGSFVYTPSPHYNGPDSFTYRASDGTSDSAIPFKATAGSAASAETTVTIDVAAVNDAPASADDEFTTAEDTPLVVAVPSVLSNDADPDGDQLTATVVTVAAHGTISLTPAGALTYTPAANYNGPDAFTYRANDGTVDGNIATVSLTVTPVNDAPVAVADNHSTTASVNLVRAAPGPLANDTDVDGDRLSAVLVSGPSFGALSLNPDGSYVYTPYPGFVGTDSFTYAATDGVAQSNPVTVTITITAAPGGILPETGVGPTTLRLTVAAILLLFVGLVAVIAGSRRRRS